MSTISLIYHDTSPTPGEPVVPSDHITGFDYRQAHVSSTQVDIWGVPIVIGLEQVLSNTAWDMVVHYVELAITQQVLDAYTNNYLLVLVDELGTATDVKIKEYPSIERNKIIDGSVVYTLKFAIQSDSVNGIVPTVLSTYGPRLFDR